MAEFSLQTSADSATLREFHTLLKAKDPGFGGRVRVMNKRQEYLWCMRSLRGSIKTSSLLRGAINGSDETISHSTRRLLRVKNHRPRNNISNFKTVSVC
jgi:hypothetical protein